MGVETCNNGIDDNKDGLIDCADPQCVMFPGCLTISCNFDVDFGTLAAHGSRVSARHEHAGRDRRGSRTCVSPGGRGRVGQFVLTATADVRVDIAQMTGAAHGVAIFRAGARNRSGTAIGRKLSEGTEQPAPVDSRVLLKEPRRGRTHVAGGVSRRTSGRHAIPLFLAPAAATAGHAGSRRRGGSWGPRGDRSGG